MDFFRPPPPPFPIVGIHAASRQRCRDRDGRAGDPRRSIRWFLVVLPPALALFGLCSITFAAYGASLCPRSATSSSSHELFTTVQAWLSCAATARRRPGVYARSLASSRPLQTNFCGSKTARLTRLADRRRCPRTPTLIIRAALISDPAGEARAALSNTMEQLGRFASGDGLSPWPAQVSLEIIRDFPAREAASYASAKQQAGALSVPAVPYISTRPLPWPG